MQQPKTNSKQQSAKYNSNANNTTTTTNDSINTTTPLNNNNITSTAQQLASKHSKLNLSFAGCGFLGIYHVGVASCFKEYAPQVSTQTISGSSAGALVAIAHICGNTQLGFATTDNLKVAMDARNRTLGPFHPNFDLNAIVAEALDRGLPDDAHKRATGVLNISLTRVSDGANVILNEFETRDELIQALRCSCFIPLYSGFVAPKVRGVAYVDGGFSNNLVTVDEHTVTVSPFCGEADICPQDESFNALLQLNFSGTSFALSPSNLHRLSNALLPAPPEVLKQLCQQGFDDGMRYLQRNKLISCNRCLNIRSPAKINVNVDEICELETLESQRARYAARNLQQQQQQQQRYLLRSRLTAAQRKRMSSVQADTDTDTNTDTDTDNDNDADIDDYNNNNNNEDDVDVDDSDDSQSICSSSVSCDSDFASMGGASVAELASVDLLLTDDDDCDDCRRRRQLALAETLPALFMDQLRDACDSVNKSLYAWIYSHWPIKYLSYMTAPYYLPLDLTLAVFVRLWQSMPSFRRAFVACLSQVINFLLDVACRVEASSVETATADTPQQQLSTSSLLWQSIKASSKISVSVEDNDELKCKLVEQDDDNDDAKCDAKNNVISDDDDKNNLTDIEVEKANAKKLAAKLALKDDTDDVINNKEMNANTKFKDNKRKKQLQRHREKQARKQALHRADNANSNTTISDEIIGKKARASSSAVHPFYLLIDSSTKLARARKQQQQQQQQQEAESEQQQQQHATHVELKLTSVDDNNSSCNKNNVVS